MTQSLLIYILAIKLLPSSVKIIAKSEKVNFLPDKDSLIEEKEIIYTFDNGVSVLYLEESEKLENEYAGQLCQEKWIGYNVLDNNRFTITPREKNFYNICQEKYWVKNQNPQNVML
ncbi:hypothetical protein [Xenorhabdus ehlersii]|uniref:Uncharacterized protein n=1 Tax=Xenorhabdus ehlersii TaxID=290111 RepID=A0A2D0IVZ0_9GAMM|nr:hypothetical protein [Xenorhabdus ehlersii]PHM25957.1 hypothetical protein Xehl_01015 [Xenorhabdus ehlersii]RKE88514.1 hypothetical protein BDE27_3148 [Xenorhabdus ehlersii]